jgi:hypothetical protein
LLFLKFSHELFDGDEGVCMGVSLLAAVETGEVFAASHAVSLSADKLERHVVVILEGAGDMG